MTLVFSSIKTTIPYNHLDQLRNYIGENIYEVELSRDCVESAVYGSVFVTCYRYDDNIYYIRIFTRNNVIVSIYIYPIYNTLQLGTLVNWYGEFDKLASGKQVTYVNWKSNNLNTTATIHRRMNSPNYNTYVYLVYFWTEIAKPYS